MQSLWMLVASFIFAVMGVCVKLASNYYSAAEIIMYRGVVGMVIVCALIKFRGGSLKTPFPLFHLGRGIFSVAGLWLMYVSIAMLPLSTAMTLNYMVPIWLAAILFGSNWWRGQGRFEWGMVAAILLSFAGVLALLRPAIQAQQWLGGGIALVSGMVSAVAYLQVKRLGQLGEPEYRVVFYFSVVSLAAGLLASLFGSAVSDSPALKLHAHSSTGVALLLAIGLTGTSAQMAMTRAYRLGKMLVTANLQYTGIVFSSIWSILIWGDTLGWSGWLGIAMILLSGSAATYYNARFASNASTAIRSPS